MTNINTIANAQGYVEDVEEELSEARDWIQRAIPYLKSELWRISDCLAMPVTTGLGADFEEDLDRSLEVDHKELTDLLTKVGALENDDNNRHD